MATGSGEGTEKAEWGLWQTEEEPYPRAHTERLKHTPSRRPHHLPANPLSQAAVGLTVLCASQSHQRLMSS